MPVMGLIFLRHAYSRYLAVKDDIEADYETLRGVLPKAEYQELDNAVLGQLLRTLNPEELKRSSGDVFGRIYEYFLTQFADLKAHDNGEFFTPVSLVSLIANVIEPAGGVVLDLMIYAVECGNRFTLDCGDIGEDFYDGLIEIYAAGTEKATQLPKDIRNIYRRRLEKIMKSSDGIGWGYHDGLCDHFDKAVPGK